MIAIENTPFLPINHQRPASLIVWFYSRPQNAIRADNLEL
nr:MAG TPA: hypothetical protein [Bacteriophage sp.]